MTIAHRKAIDVRRAAARRATPVDAVPERPGPAAPAPDDGLWEAMRRLPDKQRLTVAYHHVAGLPHREVAAIVGGSEAAARRASADGIAALRRALLDHRPIRGDTMNDLFASLSDATPLRAARPARPAGRRGRAGGAARRRVPHPRHPRRHAAAGRDPARAGAGGLRRGGPRRGARDARRAGQPAGAAGPGAARRDRPRARRVLRRDAPRLRRTPRPAAVLRVPGGGARAPAGDRLRPHRELRRRSPPRPATRRRSAPSASACATNPLPVVVPCHRVVRSDGSWGGYVGGPDAKRALLTLEGVGAL